MKKLCLVLFGLLSGFMAQSQPNSWISPASGKWEAPTNWSLGVAPAAPQSIFINNAGSDIVLVPNAVVAKRVSIDSTTASGFAGTMTVSNLALSGAGTNVVNWLALTNVGSIVPLQIPGGVAVAGGSLFMTTESILQVGGSVAVGALPPSTFIANYPATFTVSAGLAEVGSNFTVEAIFDSPATMFVQDGGELDVPYGVVGLGNDGSPTGGFGTGTATVDNGTLQAGTLIVGSPGGGLGTLSVTNNSTVIVGSDLTVMSGFGNSATSSVAISSGTVIVTNGLIQVGPLGHGLLTLSGGNLLARLIMLGSYNPSNSLPIGSGSLLISGGTLTIMPGPGNGLFANFIGNTNGDVQGSGSTLTLGDGHDAAYVQGKGAFAQFDAVYVGFSSNSFGYTGTFTESGGTFVVTSNMVVGQDCGLGDAATGTVTLNRCTLFITNATHTALLQVSNGMFTVNAGATVVADNVELGTACAQIVYNGGVVLSNLLLNPGAETGDTVYWRTTGNIGVDNGSIDPYVPPLSGNWDFIGGGYLGGSGSLSQIVPLFGNGVTPTAIDSGAFVLSVSFWEQTADPGFAGPPYDGAQVSVAYLDGTMNVIGTNATAEVASADGDWTNCPAQFLIPPGARFVQYTLEFIAYGNPDYVYVDDNFLSLYPAQPSLALNLAGTNGVLSWPAWAANYVLQCTTNLLATNSWQTLTNVPVSTNDFLFVTNAFNRPQRFYRLLSQ